MFFRGIFLSVRIIIFFLHKIGINHENERNDFMKITTRTVVRIVSLLVAVFGVLIARNIILMNENTQAKRNVTNNYTNQVETLASSVDNLSGILEKELYTGTADMHRKLAEKLYLECASAKTALSALPVEQLSLENTYKFLSQVGNYSLAVCEKIKSGEKISDEDYKNLSALYKFSKDLKEDIWELEEEISSGEISFDRKLTTENEKSPDVNSGFSDFESQFDGYPKLIYDGPFSDNIMEKKPEMTKNAGTVSKQKSLERASMAMGINATDFTDIAEVEGNMPARRFSTKDGKAVCEVTKNGGYISYFLRSRGVNSQKISQKEAVKKAEKCLNELGILSMETTYYQVEENVMTVNFAYKDVDNVDKIIYPDLVKVSVAMDNGEILGLDARGFLTNHKERTYPEKLFSETKSEEEISPKLEIKSHRLTVIPKENTEEVLCYEFSCKSSEGRNVLVYINAETGEEEQILLLEETENGTLTI